MSCTPLPICHHPQTLLLPALNPAAACPKPCSKFYDRLKELREYHKRFPVYDISTGEDDSELIKEEPKVVFTGEEANSGCVGFGSFSGPGLGVHQRQYQYTHHLHTQVP